MRVCLLCLLACLIPFSSASGLYCCCFCLDGGIETPHFSTSHSVRACIRALLEPRNINIPIPHHHSDKHAKRSTRVGVKLRSIPLSNPPPIHPYQRKSLEKKKTYKKGIVSNRILPRPASLPTISSGPPIRRRWRRTAAKNGILA